MSKKKEVSQTEFKRLHIILPEELVTILTERAEQERRTLSAQIEVELWERLRPAAAADGR